VLTQADFIPFSDFKPQVQVFCRHFFSVFLVLIETLEDVGCLVLICVRGKVIQSSFTLSLRQNLLHIYISQIFLFELNFLARKKML